LTAFWRFAACLLLLLAWAAPASEAVNTKGKRTSESRREAELVVPEDAVLQVPPEARASIDDWYIVTLADAAPDPGRFVAARAKTDGMLVSHVYRAALRGFAARIPAPAVEALRRNPNVRSIHPDQIVVAENQELPPGVARIEAAPGYKNATAQIDGAGGAVNVDVAVLDTGIDRNHPDLNYARGAGLLGAEPPNCSGESRPGIDGSGHGTHVAGIIGAKDNDRGIVGVAPGARLWSVKVLGANNAGTVSSIICGIDHVTLNAGVYEVANMSLSFTDPDVADDGACGQASNRLVDQMHRAICASVAAGVTYVAAAGNLCEDAKYRAPAAFDEVITVSAMVDTDGMPGGDGPGVANAPNACGIPASQNPNADDHASASSNWGADVDIAAPGVRILSLQSGGGTAEKTGTSMATGYVSGAAALYLATHSGASPAQVRAALLAEREAVALPGDPDGIAEGVLNVHDRGPWEPDLTPPSAPVLTITENQADEHVVGTVLFYNNRNGHQGSFVVGAVTTDPETGIAYVRFPDVFGEGGRDVSAPYQVTYSWTDAHNASGARTVTAFNGAGATANTVFTVVPDRAGPTSSFAEPATGANVTAGQVVRIDAADGGSGVHSVEVRYCPGTTCAFADGTQVGMDASAPYEVVWNASVPAGAYTLVASSTDHVGNRGEAGRVTVQVAAGARAADDGTRTRPSADAQDDRGQRGAAGKRRRESSR
jgi:hypothetical protein